MADGNFIDSLSVEISASVNPAISAIDALQDKLNILNSSLSAPNVSGYTKALESISKSVSKISGDTAMSGVANLNAISQSLQSLNGLTVPNLSGLSGLAEVLHAFALKGGSNVAANLPPIVRALSELSFVNIPDFSGFAGLAEALKALGSANARKASENLPQLASALNDLITQLSSMPEVSDKTLQLVTALGQLKGANLRAATSTKSLSNSHSVASQVMGDFTSKVKSAYKNSNFLADSYNKIKQGVSSFNQSMKSAETHTQSLVTVIVRARAVIWALKRALSAFQNSIDLASNLTEVKNVIDNVFTENYASKVEDLSKSVITSLGMSELSFKQYASRYQAMGRAMGITNSQMAEAQANLKNMGVSYGEANANMQDMSVNLTALAADLASFYDIDQQTAYEKLQAVYTGQTRPLRALGIDLTQATLAEFAMKNGLDSNIESMTQAQKTMLRYQYVLAQTKAAQGDYARTIKSWHNQVILLKELFKQLSVTIGTGLIQALKPFLMAMNTALNAVLGFAENVLNALGQIFGWEVETFAKGTALDDLADSLDDASSGISGVSDGADDTASGLSDAAKEAEKLKATILGFDELNVLNDPDSGSSSSGSGTGDGTGAGADGLGGLGATGDYGDIEYKIKKTESKFKSSIDNLYDLGKYISDTLAKTLDGIDWKKVYKKADNFGIGLADFLNGLVQPPTFESVGRTVGNSINTALHALDSFAFTFDFYNLGNSIRKGVESALYSIDWNLLHNTAVDWGYGIASFLNGTINPETFALVGQSIAKALNSAVAGAISFGSVFDGENIGRSFGTAINNALSNIKWADVLTAATLLAEDISGAINGFFDETSFVTLGDTVAQAISTAINFALELGKGINFTQVGESINTFLVTTLNGIKSDDVAETLNTWIDGANEIFDACQPALQLAVEKIFEVMSKVDWLSAIKLKLKGNFIDTGISIASGIAGGMTNNNVKSIFSAGIGILGFFAKAQFLKWSLGLGSAGTTAGAAAAGTVGGGTGLLGALASGLAPFAPYLAGIAGIALAAGLLIYGYLSGKDPEIQAKIQEGKDYLKDTREDEERNWELSYKNLKNTADRESDETLRTIETANGTIKESYDSLGRKVGELANGDYSTAMRDMQTTGEGAASGIQSAFESLTNFFSGWKLPTFGIEWEQQTVGDYSFSIPHIQRYATGGFPDAGLFFANEYGNPEMVGTIGNRPAVANNDQIVSAIKGGVMDAMMQVYSATGGFGGNGGAPTVEVTVRADSEKLYQTVQRGKQKHDRRYSVVAQM